MFGLFLLFLVGHSIAGFEEYNQEQLAHSAQPIAYGDYLTTGNFLESVAENWESEFLQMGAFIFLTAILYQKGSAESKTFEQGITQEKPEALKHKSDVPWPVKKGGWVLKVYENSLGLAFLFLFVISITLHAVGGTIDYNEEQAEHNAEPVSVIGYIMEPRFWFESFQNWQSEFLAVWAMVYFSIYLRQKESPESKAVAAPHSKTGSQ